MMSWNFFGSTVSPNPEPGTKLGNLVPVVDDSSKSYQPLDVIVGEGVDIQRNIFGTSFYEAEMRYSEFELKMIGELDEAWGKDGDPLVNTGIEETQKMRFLQGCGWNVPKAVDAIRNYVAWRTSLKPSDDLPPDRTDPRTWLYFYGRDECYRPIIVLDCYRLLEQKGDSHSLNFVQDTLIDAMNYFVHRLAVPGHVEQVVVIANLDGCSAWNTPVEEMEKCAIALTSRFRGRLNKLFILNVPLVFYAFWSVVKVFIPQRTLSKIFIYRGEYLQDLLKYINEDQIDPILKRTTDKSS